MRRLAVFLLILLTSTFSFAQSKDKPSDKFRQLSEDELPTPNEQRTASGAPGNKYWQNRADYLIDVSLDETTNRINGKETVTYHNNSPDTLAYLWMQIDPNIFAKDSDAVVTRTAPTFDAKDGFQIGQLDQLVNRTFDGRVNLVNIRDAKGN